MDLGPLTATHTIDRQCAIFTYEELEQAAAAGPARRARLARALGRLRALVAVLSRRDHTLASRVPAE